MSSAPPLPAGATSAYSAPIVNGAPARTGIACQDASDLGCDCFYTYQVEVTDTGTWSAAALNGDTVIIEESQHYAYNKAAVQEYAPATPMTATYCAIKGSQLTSDWLSGFELVLGRRTPDPHHASGAMKRPLPPRAKWACAGTVLFAAIGISVVTAAGGCTGDGVDFGCPVIGDCGGDPTGSWQAKSWCQVLGPSVYQNSALYPQQTAAQSPSLVPPQPAVRTGGDGCSELVYLPADSSNPRTTAQRCGDRGQPLSRSGRHYQHRARLPPRPFVPGLRVVNHNPDLNSSGFVLLDSAHGANPSCTDLADGADGFL